MARSLAKESDAFLSGRLVEQLTTDGEAVPPWAWTNLLAHGAVADLARERLAAGRADAWRQGRALLAAEILEVAGTEGRLGELQRSVLVPLELELASRARCRRWEPEDWVDDVRCLLRTQGSPH